MRQEKNVNKDSLPAPSRDELRAAQPQRSDAENPHPADKQTGDKPTSDLTAEEAKVASDPLATPENADSVKIEAKDLPQAVTLEKTPEELQSAQAQSEKQTDSLAGKYNFAEYDEVKYFQKDSNNVNTLECWLCKGGTPSTLVDGIDQVDAANAFQDAFNRWKAVNP